MTAALQFRDLTLGYDRHPAVHHLDGVIETGALVAVVQLPEIGVWKTPPPSQPSIVQGLPSSVVTGVTWHIMFAHVSFVVHGSVSTQLAATVHPC